MKLYELNAVAIKGDAGDTSGKIASTKKPKHQHHENDDTIEDFEDEMADELQSKYYGQSSNYTRVNTRGEDDVRGGK